VLAVLSEKPPLQAFTLSGGSMSHHTAYEIFKLANESVSRDEIISSFTEQYEMGQYEVDLVHKAIDDLVEKNILMLA